MAFLLALILAFASNPHAPMHNGSVAHVLAPADTPGGPIHTGDTPGGPIHEADTPGGPIHQVDTPGGPIGGHGH